MRAEGGGAASLTATGRLLGWLASGTSSSSLRERDRRTSGFSGSGSMNEIESFEIFS